MGTTGQPINGGLQPDEEIIGQLFTTDEERQIAARVLPLLADKANALAEAHKAAELEKEITDLREENSKMIQAKLEEIRKSMTPPTPSEIQVILSQEYAEFTLLLAKREFTIRELPASAEVRLVKVIQRTIVERLQDLAKIEWGGPTVTLLDNISKIITVVPGALETVADAVAVCLDPFNEDQAMTGEWVLRNAGVTRMLAIIHAQVTAGRYRDFLSLAFRFTPGAARIL